MYATKMSQRQVSFEHESQEEYREELDRQTVQKSVQQYEVNQQQQLNRQTSVQQIEIGKQQNFQDYQERLRLAQQDAEERQKQYQELIHQQRMEYQRQLEQQRQDELQSYSHQQQNLLQQYQQQFQEHHDLDEQLKRTEHQDYQRQFKTMYPHAEPLQKFPEGPHLGEERILQNLHLHQGSVVQFPQKITETRNRDEFHPSHQPFSESLPVKHPEEMGAPNHLLPSQARKQQTYITHTPPHPVRVATALGGSAPGSPNSRRRPPQVWPPRSSARDVPKSGFHPDGVQEGSQKRFVWPPPKPDHHRSMELPPPVHGAGPASGVWNPNYGSGCNVPISYRAPIPQRKTIRWPPPDSIRGRFTKQSSLPETAKAKRYLEFDEHVKIHANINVPPCYRAPPGTQYFHSDDDIGINNHHVELETY